MPRAPLRLAVRVVLALAASAALAAASPVRAQLGIDLSPPEKDQKAAAKKKPAPKKKAPARKPAAAKPRPAAPAPAAEPVPEPVAPLPGEPAEQVPLPPPPDTRPRERPVTQSQGMTLAPLDPAASAQAKDRLAAAKRLLDERANETAALAFDGILRERAYSEVHDEARYQRGKALVRMGLLYSALASFDELLAKGPQGSRFYHSAMEWLFYAGRKLANEQPVLARVARNSQGGFPPDHEDRFHYLLAKYQFERGRALQDAGRAPEAKAAYGEALRLAGLVREQAGGTPRPPLSGETAPPPGEAGDTFAKARFVEALVRFAQGDDTGAVESFKEVIRLTNPKRGRRADPELRELAFLQLARIHYQNRQNRYAIWYYGRMPWGGERWLDGLWEASWAHYRIGDYEKTLGNLLTIQSPYFEDEYFPESWVLEAIVYYENCRYPEARKVLDTFQRKYEPVYEQLARLTTTSQPPAAFYDVVRAGGSGTMRRILKLALTDRNIRALAESIGEIEGELDRGIGERRPEFRQSALAKELGGKLTAERARLVEEAGQRARGKLEYERDQLRALLAQALRIQIEVSRKEREALEGSLAKGSQVDVVKDLRYSTAVSDEHLYWPYEGEFWRDELGTYSYTLTKGCKDRLPRAGAAVRSR